MEYTTLGMHSHSVFPSAAASLLRSKHFNPQRKTVIFLHGFTDNPYLISGQSFALAYKLHGDYNILALDASKLIQMMYLRSSVMVKYIGETLGVIVHDLVHKGVPVQNIHLVGHSLGAHIGGFAGKAFQIIEPGKILPRITGMDPAGPCFFRSESDMRLDSGDAAFVDVIHTNIGVYGINKTIGHVDFYPNNGGLRQPGCLESVCSHNRVWQLWEESVNRPNAFIGVKCESGDQFQANGCKNNEKSPMGYATSSEVRGTFYLRTNFMIPFGLGNLGTKPLPIIG